MHQTNMLTGQDSGVSGSLIRRSVLHKTLSWLLVFLILAGGVALTARAGPLTVPLPEMLR